MVSARAAPRPDRNVLLLRPFDEIGNDQEIAREAHLDDDVELEFETGKIGVAIDRLGDLRQPGLQPRPRIPAQHFRLAIAVAGKAGKDGLAARRRDGAALRDDERVGDRLGHVLEQLDHPLGGLHPGIRGRADTIAAVNIGGAGDAQHRIMRGVEAGLSEAGGIGGDEGKIARISEVDQRILGALLDIIAASNELDIEPAREDALQPVSIGVSRLLLIVREQAGERALPAGGERDQPVGAADEGGQEDMGILMHRALEMRRRDERAKIVISRLVLRIEGEPVEDRRLAVRRARTCNREHRADDRLHAILLRSVREGHRAVEAVAVGNCRRGKA
jgi:hypothetical protein